MKREAPRHRKMLRLRLALGCPLPEAVGTLELLWHLTADQTPRGDIGRYADAELAAAVGSERDPAQLVRALVTAGWLDEHPEHRLLVHDWPQHCQDGVHVFLARQRMTFADGTLPNQSRLSKKERAYVRAKGARRAHGVRTKSAVPLPLPLPLPLPSGEEEPEKKLAIARKEKPASRAKPKVPWPDDFVLTPELAAYATRQGLDAAYEWGKFKAHALRDDVRHADWVAGWHYWCRNAWEIRQRQG